MKKVNLMLSIMIVAVVATFNACKKTDDPEPLPPVDNRVFIVNEGPFQTGSGTIDVLYRDNNTIDHKIFEQVNGRPLGNIVQSITVYYDKAYIVVNNANKIEVVDSASFESIATIENIELPRYFLGIDETKGYVSAWDNTVKVINLQNFQVEKSIPAGTGPERLLKYGDDVYVLNIGGMGNDSTVTVIDSKNDEVKTNFTVGGRPSGIVTDQNGNIWILCAGIGWNGWPAAGDTKGRLVRYDPVLESIDKIVEFPFSDQHPDDLVISYLGTILYYNYIDGIYDFNIYSDELSYVPKVKRNTMFYGLGYDPQERYLYATDPVDYVQNGWIYRYSDNGVLVDSIQAGVVPGSFFFN